MSRAAQYDLHTTEGLARVQHLRFVLSSGEVDTQYDGMTIRGGVLDDGIQEMPGSDVINGRCALQLPGLAEGCHQYDVFVSGDGTDKPLLRGVIHVVSRVTPLDVNDNSPADYLDIVTPEDEEGTITVISESPAWVDDAVEQSLQKRGVYITPVDGVTTLIMSAGSNERDFNFYTFAVNSTYISGHLSTAYKLNKITLRTPTSQNNGTRWRARLHRITSVPATQTEELGESTSTASWMSINSSTAECSWAFNAVPIAASDRLVLEVYAVDASGATISKAFIAYGAAAAQGTTEGVLIKQEGTLIWRNYSRLMMFLEVAYADGVSVGGIELASKKHFDALTADVATTSEQVHQDAEQASNAATAAQQALAAIPQVDAAGNMTLAGGLTTRAAINANGGINIPVAPSTDTEAARYKEVRLLHELEYSAVKSYFRSPNPFSWGSLLDRFTWVATGDIANFTVAKGEFSLFSRDYLNSSYNGLNSCFIPITSGLGRGWCFDSIAFGNAAFNANYTALDGDPFVTPADYMRYWIEVRIGVPDNGQCAVSVRMSRWDRTTGTVVNSSNSLSIPQSFGLRGLAVDCCDTNSGVWLVGVNKNAGRLVSYKILPETFIADSFQAVFSDSKLSLAKASGIVEAGVNTPRYYGGTILGDWCRMIQIN